MSETQKKQPSSFTNGRRCKAKFVVGIQVDGVPGFVTGGTGIWYGEKGWAEIDTIDAGQSVGEDPIIVTPASAVIKMLRR